MTKDDMKAEREWYDNADLDYSRMRRTQLRRVAGSGPRSTFAIRLEAEVIDRLREIAKGLGVGPTQLVREWIIERLSAESPSTPPRRPSREHENDLSGLSTKDLTEALRPIVHELVAEELAMAHVIPGPSTVTAVEVNL